ncbi:MAG: hypothetical protein CML07_07005 [Psychrobacter sp.]|nr:hypothetical protein [Psychrobacter sp.]
MEPLSFASFTLAGILSTFPAPGQQVSQAVITTHISPAIAGQWEIELDSSNDATFERTISNVQQSEKANITSDSRLGGIVAQDERRIVTPNPTVDKQGADLAMNLSAANAKQCREIYHFGEDNEMWAVSGDEWTYGRYIVTHMDTGLPIIALKTIYDNNEVDCSGNQVDQSNEAFIAFLNHDGNQMQWCADPEGQECFMNFKKILP